MRDNVIYDETLHSCLKLSLSTVWVRVRAWVRTCLFSAPVKNMVNKIW